MRTGGYDVAGKPRQTGRIAGQVPETSLLLNPASTKLHDLAVKVSERILRQAVVVNDEDLLQLDDSTVTQGQLDAYVALELEAAPLPASDGRVVSLSDVLDEEPRA